MAEDKERKGDKKIEPNEIEYINYQSEAQMPEIIELMEVNLSEPYSVYTYRYFINNWAKLCFMAYHKNECIGAIVCKMDPRDISREKPYETMFYNRNKTSDNLDEEDKLIYKGYIAMLVVKKEYRKVRVGTKLVIMAVEAMRDAGADEIVLETEVTNKPALKLYENLGFLRDKRLFRYYLNGLDALRLKLWFT